MKQTVQENQGFVYVTIYSDNKNKLNCSFIYRTGAPNTYHMYIVHFTRGSGRSNRNKIENKISNKIKFRKNVFCTVLKWSTGYRGSLKNMQCQYGNKQMFSRHAACHVGVV